MSYSVYSTEEGITIYISSDNKTSCVGHHPPFQQWLRDNQDNLPDDIQAKIDAGELTIADAN